MPIKGLRITGALLALLLALVPAVTHAASPQANAQRSDPGANSPAGVVYQIPFDTGRGDAAPVGGTHKKGGSGSSGTGSSGNGQAGAAAAGSIGGGNSGGGSGSGNSGSSTTGAAPPGTSPTNPSSIHSENGFGSSSAIPGVNPSAALTGAGVATASSPGSGFPIYLLLIVIALLAAGTGIAAARSVRANRAGAALEPRPAKVLRSGGKSEER